VSSRPPSRERAASNTPAERRRATKSRSSAMLDPPASVTLSYRRFNNMRRLLPCQVQKVAPSSGRRSQRTGLRTQAAVPYRQALRPTPHVAPAGRFAGRRGPDPRWRASLRMSNGCHHATHGARSARFGRGGVRKDSLPSCACSRPGQGSGRTLGNPVRHRDLRRMGLLCRGRTARRGCAAFPPIGAPQAQWIASSVA